MSGTSFALGLVGAGIGRSLTPAMQEAEGRAHGLNLTYRRIDAEVRGLAVEDLPSVVHWAQALGFDGLNITHPFKQAVLPLLDEVSRAADDLGAVNTVVIRDGRLVGHNTDWSGWGRAFRSTLPDAVTDRAVVVGAGGAGLAVAYALLDQGAAHVAIHDTDIDRAEAAAIRLGKRFAAERIDAVTDVAAAITDADGLVNATPIGMHGHAGLPVPAALVEERLWVADVVYFPLETELVALARGRGCRVLPGGGMAVGQAVDAFELFTGRRADADRIARHFAELTSS
ncbi:shikimate dehydrogenase [Nocardioides aromaticivorans]|uniref:Shikimate dehydrogenase (NADP(+)) n=1 Tax=Nocardioides aromaticivorans TaxID=200618 RepID=A0ABX7PFQ6_9ACTN|nr:shikimate dehydrogenase [Nocardioides aromaticivorans]QSR24783.1 shikimate dehydrogenase [Nocardioides aromaticivorans]